MQQKQLPKRRKQLNFLLNNILRKGVIYCSLFLFFSCGHLFYYPTQKVYFTPDKLNYKNFEEVYFSSGKNEKLHGWYIKAKQPAENLILHFHGNAQNITAHFFQVFWMHKYKTDSIVFDYRGFGKSTGKPDAAGTYDDALAALRFAYEKFQSGNYKRFIVFAQSLGGIIASRAVVDFEEAHEIDLFLLDSTFNSYQNIAFDKLTDQWITILFSPLAYVLVSDKWASKPVLKKFKVKKTLVTHGTKDRIIPLKFGEQIFKELQENNLASEMKVIPNGIHTDIFFRDGEKNQKWFIDYINSIK